MNANIEVKPHPALVGETTDLFIGVLRGFRKAREVALRSSDGASWNSVAYNYWAQKLGELVGDGEGFSGNAGAEVAEALEWLRRADAGEPEAKAVLAAIPPHYTQDEHSAEINEHADYLRGLRDIVTGDKPTGQKSGKRKAAAAEGDEPEAEDGAGEPERWAPDVEEGSAAAVLWQCANDLHDESGPVQKRELKARTLAAFPAGQFKDPENSYRGAWRKLHKEQRAFRETSEGLVPKGVK
jgi:hypothetical protein